MSSQTYRVMATETATVLLGTPSAALIADSRHAPAGVVTAYRDDDGTWQLVEPQDVEHARLHLGLDVRSVYVEAMPSETPVEYLRAEIADCVGEARGHGYDGSDEAYELTTLDCECIVEAFVDTFSRRPTRDEWRDAGRGYVGSAHYDEAL